MPVPIIAAAASVGAAAVASSGAKKAAQTAADSQSQAIQAQQQAAAQEQQQRQNAYDLQQGVIKDNPYPTYLSTAPAQEYQKTLQDRMAGRGLIDVNAETAPVANQVRAGLQQTNAATASAASARGLGRSTITASQIGNNSQAAERDIADRMSQLELARQQQVQDAVSSYGDLSRTEAQSQANKANYNVGNVNNEASTLVGNAASENANQQDIAGMIASKGTTAAANQLQQANIWGSALSGLSISANQSSQDIIDAINREQSKRNAGQVNVSGRASKSAEALNPDIYSGGF